MRRLTTLYVVLHHTVYRQNMTLQQTQAAIRRDHGVSPYHIIIGHDYEAGMRDPFDVAWHAGNWPVNLVSYAIALNGDFTKDKPTAYQIDRLGHHLRVWMSGHRISRQNVKLHKEVRLWPTACPGFGHSLVDMALGVKPTIHRVNEALRICGDDPARSVGTLNLSKWWQNRVTRDPEKFTNDEKGFKALVGAIKWHQANKRYPHDN